MLVNKDSQFGENFMTQTTISLLQSFSAGTDELDFNMTTLAPDANNRYRKIYK